MQKTGAVEKIKGKLGRPREEEPQSQEEIEAREHKKRKIIHALKMGRTADTFKGSHPKRQYGAAKVLANNVCVNLKVKGIVPIMKPDGSYILAHTDCKEKGPAITFQQIEGRFIASVNKQETKTFFAPLVDAAKSSAKTTEPLIDPRNAENQQMANAESSEDDIELTEDDDDAAAFLAEPGTPPHKPIDTHELADELLLAPVKKRIVAPVPKRKKEKKHDLITQKEFDDITKMLLGELGFDGTRKLYNHLEANNIIMIPRPKTGIARIRVEK